MSRKIMRTRREYVECRPSMCHECADALKAVSKIGGASEKQGEQHEALSPNAGIEASDPAIQLANITVELDDGCVERIKINDNESAEEVAKKVCLKNDLPDQFVALLAEHIIDRYPKRAVDKKNEEVTAATKKKEDTVVNKKKEEVTVNRKKEEVTLNRKKEEVIENRNETEESKTVKIQSGSSNSRESKEL